MTNRPHRITLVAGARPNFMKIAPLYRALGAAPQFFQTEIVHTGQHYDHNLSQIFFDEFNLPRPDYLLEAGAGSHARQTATVLTGFEDYLIERRPDLVVVVGDVNSTVAAALAAAKLHIPIAHVEAGLRSGDRRMPEEINRIVTDHLADILYTHCVDAVDNLRHEGVPEPRIKQVGNVMIDTLTALLPHVEQSTILADRQLAPGDYLLCTIHRAENVSDPGNRQRIIDVLRRLCADHRIVFPIHPRTRDELENGKTSAAWREVRSTPNLILLDPVGYFDFIRLQKDARAVLTDSGGVQEETTFLGIPCLTLRENTERPVTIYAGTNRLVGLDVNRIEAAVGAVNKMQPPPLPPLGWDGSAAKRIVNHLTDYFDIARAFGNRQVEKAAG